MSQGHFANVHELNRHYEIHGARPSVVVLRGAVGVMAISEQILRFRHAPMPQHHSI
jgi:hypothetical protein